MSNGVCGGLALLQTWLHSAGTDAHVACYNASAVLLGRIGNCMHACIYRVTGGAGGASGRHAPEVKGITTGTKYEEYNVVSGIGACNCWS